MNNTVMSEEAKQRILKENKAAMELVEAAKGSRYTAEHLAKRIKEHIQTVNNIVNNGFTLPEGR
jgi:hypothetical protein